MKATKKMTIEGAEKRYPTIEQGGEILPTSADDAKFRWTASQLEAFKDAPTGNHKAWKIIYALAASFARDGVAMPEPLSTLMAERLQAISNVLSNPEVKDTRAAFPDAVLTTAERDDGAKGKPFSKLMTEEVLLQAMCFALPSELVPKVTDMLQAMPDEALPFAARVTTVKHIDAAIAYMVEKKLTKKTPTSLRAAAKTLRSELRSREK